MREGVGLFCEEEGGGCGWVCWGGGGGVGVDFVAELWGELGEEELEGEGFGW